MTHRALIERLADALDEVINPYPLAKSEVNADVAAAREYLAAPEQSEPIKHKHEWFRTGAMEPGICRCIHCGEWSKEDTHPAPSVNAQLLEALKMATSFKEGGKEMARAAIAVAEEAK